MMEADGHLTTELEQMILLSTQPFNTYWCKVAQEPKMHCLDIGAPTTLSGSYTLSELNGLDNNNPHLHTLFNTSTQNGVILWGQNQQCDEKTVSDGIINVFDVSILMSYIFKEGPYNFTNYDPKEVKTTEGRHDLIDRCDDGQSNTDYITEYINDSCGDMRRRLEEDTIIQSSGRWFDIQSRTSVNTQMAYAEHAYVVSNSREEGTWYSLQTQNVPLSIYIGFDGITSEDVYLNNAVFDVSNTPANTEVRFTRSCEFSNPSTCFSCAELVTVSPDQIVIVDQVLQLRQSPFDRACPLQLHLWVPRTSQQPTCCSMKYLLMNDGIRGAYAQNVSCPDVTEDNESDATLVYAVGGGVLTVSAFNFGTLVYALRSMMIRPF